MSVSSNARRLIIVPDREESDSHKSQGPSTMAEPVTCSFCFGAGMEVIPGKGARRCQCRTQDHQTKLLEAAHIPRRYDECSLSNYHLALNNASQLRAFNYAYRLVNEYPAIERGLLFMGTVGIGKTHLAIAILKELLRKGVPCFFYEFGALLKEIQESYNPLSQSSELDILAPIFEVDVLVLDELGGAKSTDWVRDTIMHIISTRYNECKLTIFTTNYFDERRNARDETLEDRIGSRIRSRLYEMCRSLVLEGEDFRRSLDSKI